MSHVIKLLFTTILHCTFLTSPMLTAQEATLVVPAGEDVAASVPSSFSDSELLSVEDVVRRSEELAQSNRSFRVRCQLRSATMSPGKFTSTYASFWTGAKGQELAVRIRIDKKTLHELHQRRIFDLTAAMENMDVELEGHVEMVGSGEKIVGLIIKDLKHVHSPLPQITGNEPAQQKAALEFLLQKLKSTIHSYDRFHIQYELEVSKFELEQNEAGFKNHVTDLSQSTQLEVKGPTSKAVTKTTVLKEEIQSAPRHWFSFEQRFDKDGMRNAWVQSLATAEGVSSRTNRNPQPTVPADFDSVNRKESLGTLTFNLLERNAGQRGGKPDPEISLINYFRSDQGDVRLDWTEDGVRVSKTTEPDQSGFSKWEVTFSQDHDWHPVRVAKLFSEVDGHQGQFLADGHQRQFLAEWRATELEMVDGVARVKSGELICPAALPTRNGSDLMLSKSTFRIRKATYGDAVTAELDWHAVPESPTLDAEVTTQLQEPQQPGLTAPNVNSTLGSATQAMSSRAAEPPAIFEQPMVPIAEYRRRVSDLELPLLQLAEKVRSTEASVGKDHADSAKLRADLRALVQQTFAARQEIQRAELAEFTRRLQRMQQSIDARDRIADKIVERRFEELLNPNLQWDSTRLGAPGSNSTNRPRTSTQPQFKVADSTAFDSPHEALIAKIRPQDWGEPNQGLRLAVVPTTENSPADEALEVLVVLKNELQHDVTFLDTGWYRDIEFTVRSTSGSQVRTHPIADTGRFQPRTMVLASGQSTVIAVRRIRVVEGLVPNDIQAELFIIDPNAFEFRNAVYTMSCELRAELLHVKTTVPLHSGTIGMAFSRPEPVKTDPADVVSGSSDTSDKLSVKTPDDQNAAAWLQKLQGVWTIEKSASGLGENPDAESIAKSGEVRIDGPLITIPFTQGNGRADIPMLLEIQRHGDPQGVNITIDPNGLSTKALGIIDCDGDRLRLCIGQWAGIEEVPNESSRPKVFAAGSDVTFLECRKTPKDVAAQSSTGHGFQSPEALLDYMTDCLLKEDFANFMQLLTDDEAKRIAGLMLQSAYSIMTVSGIAAKDLPESVEQNPHLAAFAGIGSVLQSSMRSDASPEAEAAFEQLAFRATQANLTGGSGTPLELNPDDYSQLLKTAAGVLKDDRIFVAEVSKALMALNSKSQVSDFVPSRPTWTIVIDGDVAIATDTRKIVESSGNVNLSGPLELKRIGGYWKVSKLISDKALREAAAGPAVSDSTDTKPPASKEGTNQSAIPSDMSGPETITPLADRALSGPVAVAATGSDNTQPPVSDAEKAIARMVFVFFQDEARRTVPGLLIDRGSETLVITVGPASIVPDGVAHAIDRSFLEVAGEPSVESMIFDTKTADIIIARAKAGLTTFQLKEPVLLEIGDSLSAIQLQGRQQLRVTPNAARITAMNQSITFELESHRFLHEFSGLVQIDQRLPEGTPLFKDGQLAGFTLLGTRFMKVDVPGSYVVPAGRIFEVLQQLKLE